jgi:ubiquinone/menaquinone biosynthesis C-methylase UbiE
MTRFHTTWKTFLDRQHRYPTGLAGRLIGERMLRQHAPETIWTLGILDLQPADRVLELGFGAGRGLALAARQAVRGMVTGVDLSAAMLRAASLRNRSALTEGRLALLRGNLSALPFSGQRFDKIFSIHTFYFWPNPLRLCTELVSMLNPGGRLAITLATGRMNRSGEWTYWPVHQEIQALAGSLQQLDLASAQLRRGPNSRRYNNIAIVVQK